MPVCGCVHTCLCVLPCLWLCVYLCVCVTEQIEAERPAVLKRIAGCPVVSHWQIGAATDVCGSQIVDVWRSTLGVNMPLIHGCERSVPEERLFIYSNITKKSNCWKVLLTWIKLGKKIEILYFWGQIFIPIIFKPFRFGGKPKIGTN